jgi:hypothetical protein
MARLSTLPLTVLLSFCREHHFGCGLRLCWDLVGWHWSHCHHLRDAGQNYRRIHIYRYVCQVNFNTALNPHMILFRYVRLHGCSQSQGS